MLVGIAAGRPAAAAETHAHVTGRLARLHAAAPRRTVGLEEPYHKSVCQPRRLSCVSCAHHVLLTSASQPAGQPAHREHPTPHISRSR